MFRSINPANGKLLQTYEELTPIDLEAKLQRAASATTAWKARSFATRAEILRSTAKLLRERREQYATLMTNEMGKPIRQGRSEIDKCAWVCEYYADNAASHLADLPIPTESRSFVAFEPLGIVLAIMPWNFPFWQVFRFAAPALMAGNIGLLKHASNVMGCALAIEEIFRDAGVIDGAFQSLLLQSSHVADVIRDPRVRAVTLTGSTPAGEQVAMETGKVLKKVVLELGGSDPYLVLDDADIDAAAKSCATSRCINNGQSCIAAKRFIVVQSVLDDFTTRFTNYTREQRLGDPQLDSTDIGPLARIDLRETLHNQIRRSVGLGARLLLGGEVPAGDGAFYPPTVLGDVTPGMPAFDEELFGPAAAIIAARDEQHAIELANASTFGLGAAVFTRNLDRGERVARQLESGSVAVNAFVASDPRLPFGGVKQSGYGRELGQFGIREFVNVKTIVVHG